MKRKKPVIDKSKKIAIEVRNRLQERMLKLHSIDLEVLGTEIYMGIMEARISAMTDMKAAILKSKLPHAGIQMFSDPPQNGLEYDLNKIIEELVKK